MRVNGSDHIVNGHFSIHSQRNLRDHVAVVNAVNMHADYPAVLPINNYLNSAACLAFHHGFAIRRDGEGSNLYFRELRERPQPAATKSSWPPEDLSS